MTEPLASLGKGQPQEAPPSLEGPEEGSCLYCGQGLAQAGLYARYRVCPGCHFHYSLSARERIDLLADPGTFKEINRRITSLDPLSFSGRVSYRQSLSEAQRRTGLTEAAVTGLASIEDSPAVVVVLDFAFMGGSMGSVVGEKVALAFEMAIKKRLPLVSVATSGGARLQEGVLSLMQMAKTAAAAQRLHAAGLPFISILANPTTGEVYASFANLGDILIAEPGALMGLAPLRVMAEATEKPLPEATHTAEFHFQHGLVDQVVARPQLRELVAVLLYLLGPRYRLVATRKSGRPVALEPRPAPVWQTVQLARHRGRPTALDYIGRIASSFVEIHGDRLHGDDGAVVCGLADLGGQAVVMVGQQRTHRQGQAYPEGFRKAQRALRLAAKFHLPVITLIDTSGAYPGLEAEERGIGNAIASTLALLSNLPTPVISAIIGEGGSEGALALSLSDRLLMQENAIFSAVSPERAAAILYRDPARAQEVSPSLRLTAADCLELRVVDGIIPEPQDGAHNQPEEAARLLKRHLMRQLLTLQGIPPAKLVRDRYDKFRRMGRFSRYFQSALSQEVARLGGFLEQAVKDILAPPRRRPEAKEEAPPEEPEPLP